MIKNKKKPAKCDALNTHYEHRAEIPVDDGLPVRFLWHFPRGTFTPRMSGFEISMFILREMGAIIGMGLLDNQPRVVAEFEAMWKLLAQTQVVYHKWTKQERELSKWGELRGHRIPDDEDGEFRTEYGSEETRKSVSDKLLSWLRIVPGGTRIKTVVQMPNGLSKDVVQAHEDDMIYLSLHEIVSPEPGKAYFDMGVA